MWRKEREMWQGLITAMEERMVDMRHEAADERRELLSRIQHPEIVPHATPTPQEPYEPPRDAAEHAWIGEVVPDFVDVGTKGEANAEHPA